MLAKFFMTSRLIYKLFCLNSKAYQMFFNFDKHSFKVRIIGIVGSLVLQGIFTTASAEWDNFWPFWVAEENCCEAASCKENVLGPIFEQKITESGCLGAFRPIALHMENDKYREKFDYLLYPIFSHHRFQGGYNWNMFNLFAGGNQCNEKKLTLFPILLGKQTGDPCTSYSAMFPFGGKVRNFLGKDAIGWLMFPLYLQIEHRGSICHSLPWPFIRWQTGPDSGGLALWPIFSHFWKEGEYDHGNLLWPLIYEWHDDLSCPVPSIRKGFLPFYAYEDSARRYSWTVIWPFFSHIEMRNRNYVEDHLFWPFFVQGRGDNEYVNRWAPFYTHSIRRGIDKRWYLWPLFKIVDREECGVHINQQQLLYFVFWKQTQRSIENPCWPEAKKVHLWPLYCYWDNGAGKKQFQLLSPFEVFFPTNQAVRNLYSPLFAIFRFEQLCPGHSRYSILFDLIATEKTATSQRLSIGPLLDVECGECKSQIQILKGFLGYVKENGKKSFKFLWISF